MKAPELILEQMIDIMPFKFIEGTRPYILEAMRIFANEACIEQRKICASNIIDCELNLCNNDEYINDVILGSHLAVLP